MRSSPAHACLWSIAKELSFDSALRVSAGDSTSSILGWARRRDDYSDAFERPENCLRTSETRGQPLRIERSVDFGVVVEVNENVELFGPSFGARDCFGIARLFSFAPMLYAVGPPIQRLVIVTADVKFLVAVQTDVNKVGGQIFRVRPFLGGVCKHEGDLLLAQEREELRHHKTRMPNLDRVAKRSGCRIDLHPGPRFQFVVMLFREFGNLRGITRKNFEKLSETLWIPAKVGRQLPKNWAEFSAKREHARSEKVGQRRFDIAQFFHVCDEMRTFNAENEIVRRLGIPTLITRRSLQGVK